MLTELQELQRIWRECDDYGPFLSRDRIKAYGQELLVRSLGIAALCTIPIAIVFRIIAAIRNVEYSAIDLISTLVVSLGAGIPLAFRRMMVIVPHRERNIRREAIARLKQKLGNARDGEALTDDDRGCLEQLLRLRAQGWASERDKDLFILLRAAHKTDWPGKYESELRRIVNQLVRAEFDDDIDTLDDHAKLAESRASKRIWCARVLLIFLSLCAICSVLSPFALPVATSIFAHAESQAAKPVLDSLAAIVDRLPHSAWIATNVLTLLAVARFMQSSAKEHAAKAAAFRSRLEYLTYVRKSMLLEQYVDAMSAPEIGAPAKALATLMRSTEFLSVGNSNEARADDAKNGLADLLQGVLGTKP